MQIKPTANKKSTQVHSQKVSKPKGGFILSIPNFDTRIDKELYWNDKEILISEKKIQELPKDSVIWDGEMLKISLSKNGYKKVIRYFQVTKTEFKYYNSIFSSSVWNDKPLFRTPIIKIENISISNDDMIKMKFNDVKFAFHLIIKNLVLNIDLRRRDKDVNVIKSNNEDVIYLEFGWEDPEIGIALIKVLMLLKRINKNLIEDA